MNGAISSYIAPIEELSPEEYLRWRKGRELAYNVFMSSLDVHELEVYLQANVLVDESLQSLELHLFDRFVNGEIGEDTIGAEILVLLGEM